MTNEQKFLGYLSNLKGDKNQKLIECVQEGFKTLVEYQVVGNMSERGVDLMEGEGLPENVPDAVRSLVEKLTNEIEELRDAMGEIDTIADDLVPDEVEEESEAELEEVGEVEERTPVEEGTIHSSDQGEAAANLAYEQSSKQEELGGIKNEKNSGISPDVASDDIVPIETGERREKVESGRAPVEECELCPGSVDEPLDNNRKPVTEFAPAVGLVAKLGAQLLAGAALDKLIARVVGDEADSSEKAEIGKEIEAAAGKMRDSQTESLSSEELPANVRQGESAGNDADDTEFVDHEGKMANKQLDQIADQSERLAGSFDDQEELKAWVQVKITKAQETIDALYDFFRVEKGLDDAPEASEEVDSVEVGVSGVDEQPIFEK